MLGELSEFYPKLVATRSMISRESQEVVSEEYRKRAEMPLFDSVSLTFANDRCSTPQNRTIPFIILLINGMCVITHYM